MASPPRTDVSISASRYGLAMLFLVALFNYIDRSIISILQEPLKADLKLSDTQLGALTGLSFALMYTTMALPIARLADVWNRKRLIAGALAIWSAATAACGLANGFGTLVALRMGVAFGEAGCVPASHSMIADYFPLRQRATALALWGLSNPFGTMLGFAAGGWITQTLGWREAFLLFGIAGVALAPLVLTMKEPQRGRFDEQKDTRAQVPLREALATLWKLKAFRFLAAGGAAHAFVVFAAHNWNAPFFGRVHEMPIGQVALYLALAIGLGGGTGQFVGGWLADRLGRGDRRWYMWLPAAASVLLIPFSLGVYLIDDTATAMAMGAVQAVLLNVWFAPIVATAQMLVASQMRAFTSAMLVLIVNILGLSLGPLMTGMISDALQPSLGAESLRYAILTSMGMSVVAALCFFRSGQHLKRELLGATDTAASDAAEPARA
ncbi:MFS transporter, partial [Phenylobacterium sp.]|uniref:spinster family MFS transporter n=1 Tax=Phenylobacterium sp. TaxID=1871053 RepID=UPI002EDA4EB4